MLTLATEGAVQELTVITLVVSIFAHMRSSSEAIACHDILEQLPIIDETAPSVVQRYPKKPTKALDFRSPVFNYFLSFLARPLVTSHGINELKKALPGFFRAYANAPFQGSWR
jgi:hypothetical protein